MNRASPVDLRKAMDVTLVIFKAGVLFVPMPVLDGADHTQLVTQLNDRLERIALKSEEAEALAVVEAPPAVKPWEARYFVNHKSRLCKILQGGGPAHEANVAQAKKERFVEVTQEHQAEFQADTDKARAAGWKPFGRMTYANFMEKQGGK
jgi:hypothetical protein